mmetsp:Transcript_68830/g.140011  ORF Transcript_68830/g.140011 Transcript_68830/m.140011 type:complete len:241 (+) Transcript_68830:122-844(+)
MYLYSDSWVPDGPPPVQVLETKWQWRFLVLLLVICFVLRIIGTDMAGAILSGLMFCFALVMMRNSMQEMTRYACTYGILCILNFVLDIVPLIAGLDGRVTKHTEPVSVVNEQGQQHNTYKMTQQVTRFFEPGMGVIYNTQSVAMIVSPLAMLLGAYLSISAHLAFQRTVNPAHSEADETGLPAAIQGAFQGIINGRRPSGHFSARQPAGANGGRRDLTVAANAASARETFERFQGQSYKL